MINTVFFDRDGVINEVVQRDGHFYSPRQLKDFKVRPDFIRLYRILEPMKLKMLVVSNQPDLARGLMSAECLEEMNQVLLSQFHFLDIRYCTHDDRDQCSCRKPKPGMLLELMARYHLRTEEAMIIGDGWKDMEAGRQAGIKTVYLATPYNRSESVVSDYRVDCLDQIVTLPIFGGES
ncbi:MAG: HAD-IIIA family hydrolase [Candidatus Delongbacteria bacterium]|nr:HAD-IIIA family hydrolase [Candidatus Delongbacteria bacterium]